MANASVLDVLLYNMPVGTLTHVGGDQTLFAFNDDYIGNENRPTLSLGFKDALGQLITDLKPTRTRLLPFFSNLLPEGHLRKYLAERAAVKSEREFFLAWALGMDLPGAITIKPAEGNPWPPIMEDKEHGQDDADHRRANMLRFSLAGIQLKFSAINEATGGLTFPAKGVGGSWIVKLPSVAYAGVPENEYSMMTLARNIGINVPATQLVDIGAIKNLPKGLQKSKRQALAIERFDRMDGETAVHIEDFAQIFGVYPEKKYDKANYRNIGAVIAAESDDADIAEFVRRLTFNTLIGNADMHLKNWSVIYPDRRSAALAPAYDFVSTIAYIPDTKAALNFSRTKRFDEFTEDELSHLAAKARLPERLVLDTARETVSAFQDAWASEKAHLPLTKSVIQAIEKHLKSIPLVRGR